MICYEANPSKVEPGILLDSNTKVLRRSGDAELQALLSGELVGQLQSQAVSPVFTLSKARIHRCDVDMRSDLWLLPEMLETAEYALVLFRQRLIQCSYVVPSVDGVDSKVLTQVIDSDSDGSICLFAQLAPGGSLTVESVQATFVREQRWSWRKQIFSIDEQTVQVKHGENGQLSVDRTSRALGQMIK